MFNLTGSEVVFLLILALIILGPEKLPEAVRKFGKMYSEVRNMATGFQSELKQALDEPMREVRETADLMRKSVSFDDSELGIKDLFKGGPAGLLSTLAGTNQPASAPPPAISPTEAAATPSGAEPPFAPSVPDAVAPDPVEASPGPNSTSAAPTAAPAEPDVAPDGPNFASAAPSAAQWTTQPATTEPATTEPAASGPVVAQGDGSDGDGANGGGPGGSIVETGPATDAGAEGAATA